MYINSIEIVSDHRCFNKGEDFKLENITLLVGDQGCGKSTLLNGIQENDEFLEMHLSELGQKGVDSFYFDSEKMNPRIKDPNTYTNMDGSSKGIGFSGAVTTRYTSHGETLVLFTVEALKQAENSVIILDEPESGLSLKNQFLLAKEIKEAAKRNCQLIIATHSLVLIKAFKNVLSLEHKKWMKSVEFVKLNRNL